MKNRSLAPRKWVGRSVCRQSQLETAKPDANAAEFLRNWRRVELTLEILEFGNFLGNTAQFLIGNLRLWIG
ncbi:MAG: hypothetical protein MUE44_20120 [Oscillatoriaceae cyanobacterium Prado104]|jgi:hypothetical protein|nr:hypothetical protein [Oscillatoriaceae cyanobacterium Prado104]